MIVQFLNFYAINNTLNLLNASFVNLTKLKFTTTDINTSITVNTDLEHSKKK